MFSFPRFETVRNRDLVLFSANRKVELRREREASGAGWVGAKQPSTVMLWPRFCVPYGIRHIINLVQTRSIAKWAIPNCEVHRIYAGPVANTAGPLLYQDPAFAYNYDRARLTISSMTIPILPITIGISGYKKIRV